MRAGRVADSLPSLAAARARCAAELATLSEACVRLRRPARYPVTVSPQLRVAQDAAVAAIRRERGRTGT